MPYTAIELFVLKLFLTELLLCCLEINCEVLIVPYSIIKLFVCSISCLNTLSLIYTRMHQLSWHFHLSPFQKRNLFFKFLMFPFKDSSQICFTLVFLSHSYAHLLELGPASSMHLCHEICLSGQVVAVVEKECEPLENFVAELWWPHIRIWLFLLFIV